MLKTPTIEKMEQLKLTGMLKALKQQEDMSDLQKLAFEERLGLLIDSEFSERENTRLTKRLQTAKLRHQACFEDISFKYPRGLDRSLILQLANCDYINKGLSVIITGPTGVGKSYVSCALGNKACREGHSVNYQRAPRFFQDLTLSRVNGSYNRFLAKLAKTSLLVLDDFALTPITEEQCRDLLEVVDDRCNRTATIFCSQLPFESWHKTMSNPTIADAILDRVVHSSYKVSLTGPSLRPPRKGAQQKESD